MELYRGLRDVLPDDITDAPGDGIYGTGVYLSRRLEVAKWYGFKSFDLFGIVVEYSITGASLLNLSEGIHFKDDHPTNELFFLTPKGMKLLGVTRKELLKRHILGVALKLGYHGICVNLANWCEEIVAFPSYDPLFMTGYYFKTDESEILKDPPRELMLGEIQKMKLYFGQA